MPLSLRKIAFLLACSARVSQSWRLQTSSKRAQAEEASNPFNGFETLAALLVSHNPAASFNPMSLRGASASRAALISEGRTASMLVPFMPCCIPLMASGDFDFDSNPGWKKLQTELDLLPTFTVANEQGVPLEYEMDGKPLAMFFADLQEAKAELAKAQEEFPDLNCDLIPVGLGTAYKLSCQGKASLFPNTAELRAAGAADGASFRELPLFACMEMSQDSATGAPMLPLFQSWQDCSAQVRQVFPANDQPDIAMMPLSSVVERLASVSVGESVAFRFIPASASAKYIADYLGL